MLGVGWPELMVVAVVTVLVVGPKELPRVLRTFSLFMKKAREMSSEFTSGMEDLARQADLDDVKKIGENLGKDMDSSFNIAGQMDELLDPQNTVAGMFTGTAVGGPIGTIGTPTAGSNQAVANMANNVTALEKSTSKASAAEPPPSAVVAGTVVTGALIKDQEPGLGQTAGEPISLEKRRAGSA